MRVDTICVRVAILIKIIQFLCCTICLIFFVTLWKAESGPNKRRVTGPNSPGGGGAGVLGTGVAYPWSSCASMSSVSSGIFSWWWCLRCLRCLEIVPLNFSSFCSTSGFTGCCFCSTSGCCFCSTTTDTFTDSCFRAIGVTNGDVGEDLPSAWCSLSFTATV